MLLLNERKDDSLDNDADLSFTDNKSKSSTETEEDELDSRLIDKSFRSNERKYSGIELSELDIVNDW